MEFLPLCLWLGFGQWRVCGCEVSKALSACAWLSVALRLPPAQGVPAPRGSGAGSVSADLTLSHSPRPTRVRRGMRGGRGALWHCPLFCLGTLRRQGLAATDGSGNCPHRNPSDAGPEKAAEPHVTKHRRAEARAPALRRFGR